MKFMFVLPMAVSLTAAQMTVMTLLPSPTSGPMTHTVVVGGVKPVATGMAAVLGYSPEAITARVNDVVVFNFMQRNHTATQSTFAKPCEALPGGMDSGFMPNPDGKAGVTWNMTVKTTDPLFFYCKQQTGGHCGKGMVFSVNAPPTGDTMALFKQNAIQQNGTALTTSPIQQIQPGAQAVPTTVTIQAGAATPSGSGATSLATVVAGQGTNSSGGSCSCSCLCGVNSFPQMAAQNSFGGFAGMIP